MQNSKFFDEVVAYITESSIRYGFEKLLPHFERTVYWTQQLDPGADESQLIAAFAHDAERVTQKKKEGKKRNHQDDKALERHQIKGAEIMRDFLNDIGASNEMANQVYHLISKHEVGGDRKQNILMDADSLSFLECNVDLFIKKVPTRGEQQVKEKFDWMYERISSKKAKSLAKPMYEVAISKLKKARV